MGWDVFINTPVTWGDLIFVVACFATGYVVRKLRS